MGCCDKNTNKRFNVIRLVAALLVLAFSPLYGGAQEPETPVRPTPDTIPSFMIEAGSPEHSGVVPEGVESPTGWSSYAPLYRSLESWHVSRSFAVSSRDVSPEIASWSGGSIYASGAATHLPGMMGVESGRLNFSQSAGAVTFTAWAEAMKYGYFRGLQSGWGFGGAVDYRINDRWSVTLFGEYYSPVHPLTPGMAESMALPRFGGYASYNFSDHWGIRVGAQSSRSLITNRWETSPIVMPYYRINRKVSLGIDVGGILYNAVRSYIESRDNRHGPMPMGGPRPR